MVHEKFLILLTSTVRVKILFTLDTPVTKRLFSLCLCSLSLILFLTEVLHGQSYSDEISISLDKDELVLPCPPGHQYCGNEQPSYDFIVNISVSLGKRARIPFSYEVTGGRVIGKATQIKWDLAKVSPGSYRISLHSGTGENRITAEAVVTVIYAECICDPECPAISVEAAKDRARPGETLDFEAKVYGGSQNSVGYKWEASPGLILEGGNQGRVKVQIPADTKPGTEIKIILIVGGLIESWGCPTRFEKNITIESAP